jgi:hypothetical protein
MYSFSSNHLSLYSDLAPKHGRQRMQEIQDSIPVVCKGEVSTVTATMVLLLKKRKTNLMLLMEEGNSLGCLHGPRIQG